MNIKVPQQKSPFYGIHVALNRARKHYLYRGLGVEQGGGRKEFLNGDGWGGLLIRAQNRNSRVLGGFLRAKKKHLAT